MYSFKNDYNQVAHPDILKRLEIESLNQYVGYGEDEICKDAVKKISAVIENDAFIHFVVGGTQANKVVISAILKPYQGVISADIGHINTHETGAIENNGHKVLSIKSNNGKLKADDINAYLADYYDDETREHMVMPGMVYISNPTELGTIYSKQELINIKRICEKYKIPLYMDGARLAYLFNAKNNDIKFKDFKELVDVYYIGGTKCGAMFGEAIIFNNSNLAKDFRYYIKQNGALLAKGFLLGLQFDELFKDQLYLKLGDYSNKLAVKLEEGLKQFQIKMYAERESNQLFPILSNSVINKLKKEFDFETWIKINNNFTCIRLVISWATDEKMIDCFLETLRKNL